MGREIKFRAWRPQLERFRFFDISTGFNVENTDVFGDVEQYTGLKDKNGVEIYEGDIVKCRFRKGIASTRYIGEVKFSSVYCSLIAAGVKQYFGDKPYLHELSMLEVIGNIHQNPELLNDK